MKVALPYRHFYCLLSLFSRGLMHGMALVLHKSSIWMPKFFLNKTPLRVILSSLLLFGRRQQQKMGAQFLENKSGGVRRGGDA